MSTEIKVWQISGDQMEILETTMPEAGRREVDHLERWLKSNPSILGDDFVIIGEQVQTASGPVDFLGVDRTGNLVIVELKRDRVPREALAQAIDYASDLDAWDYERLNQECLKHTRQTLEEYLAAKAPDMDLEQLTLNDSQRILLVGTAIEDSLQRMIGWLSEKYGVGANAIVLKYIRTANGEDLLARTMVLPEELVRGRSKRHGKKFEVVDEPGNYDEHELRDLLLQYLKQDKACPRRIRNILLPLCLQQAPSSVVTRDQIIDRLVATEGMPKGMAGTVLSTISREMGWPDKDYLRQVIRYDKGPNLRDNYRVHDQYRDLVTSVMEEMAANG